MEFLFSTAFDLWISKKFEEDVFPLQFEVVLLIRIIVAFNKLTIISFSVYRNLRQGSLATSFSFYCYDYYFIPINSGRSKVKILLDKNIRFQS